MKKKKNVNFYRRKIRKLKLTSSTTLKLYKKFDQSISPEGRTKFDELVKSLRETPNLDSINFHETLEKEGIKHFPHLKVEEVDVLKFIALNRYIEQLEEDLKNAGDDAQLENIDMQNMLEKQQQTMQMLSNVSKMLHDTAMAAIRKIG
ncbi:hypothetical protein LCGC14_0802680 [marine sediment metagenome]|uniref:Uncharacterized protein n=1 Tax=marine sediment metagenome TaxID=412755 RepID=A0A0F9S939_9ZZZZ|nr:MAG: hypothetical protein Lokiarch_18750 [Candidatus Lokiarchaeum sp. GC14_75]